MPANAPPATSRSYLGVIGFTVILAVFFVLSYLPNARQREALLTRIADSNDQLADMAAQGDELKTTSEHITLISAQVTDYDRLVPASQDLGTFLGQLSRELAAAGLKDSAVQAMAPVTLGKCEQLPIEIHGTGTAAQCCDFLTRLEALPRKSSVSHVALQADAAMTGKVTMELTLSIYNLKP